MQTAGQRGGLRRACGGAPHRGHADELIPPAYLAKGNYFSCSARAPFSRLIYPVPEPGGLGVHLTLDMAGQARFGPDVEWVESIDYAVDPAAPTGSIRRSGATGRRCRTAR